MAVVTDISLVVVHNAIFKLFFLHRITYRTIMLSQFSDKMSYCPALSACSLCSSKCRSLVTTRSFELVVVQCLYRSVLFFVPQRRKHATACVNGVFRRRWNYLSVLIVCFGSRCQSRRVTLLAQNQRCHVRPRRNPQSEAA